MKGLINSKLNIFPAKRVINVVSFSLLMVLAALCSLTALTGQTLAAPEAQANTISGNVFRDFNANGAKDTREPGVAGIAVTATNAAGAVVGSATTNSNGDYSLAVPDGTQVRVEFGNIPTYLYPGPAAGTSLQTTVAFVTSPANAVNLALANPGQHCQATPDLATSCYVAGPQTVISDVVIGFPIDAGNTISNSTTGVDSPAHTLLARANQAGSTWGLAYQRSSGSVFVAAFMKRHAGFGPNGPGAIYRIDSGGGVNLFTTLSAGSDPHPTNSNPCPGQTSSALSCWEHDPNSWDAVGKLGLGDLDISEDDSTLYAVNLSDRLLYEIPIGLPPTGPTPGTVSTFNIPNPCGNSTDFRPFGLGLRDGNVYVGVTCTAESSQNAANLSATVYEFDPLNPGFTAVLNIPLNYPRGCAIVNTFSAQPHPCNLATWRPWSPTFVAVPAVFPTNAANEHIYPQPWLTDIEFDTNGDMIIGLRDRYGDQTGFNQRSTNINDTTNTLYSGDAAGDILRACLSGTTWTLESNGQCGGIGPGPVSQLNTNPAIPGTGPGGAEYYNQENYPLHDEITLGGLVHVPGRPDVIVTGYDPVYDVNEPFDGGVLWLDNTTGARLRQYRVFDTADIGGTPPVVITNAGFTFGKGGGLGDLEALCDAAPIEIGNRVWLDLDQDGVQGAGETPIAGVIISLYDSTGTLVATTTTNAAGEYFFTSRNDGVLFGQGYEIRIEDPRNFSPGGPLEGLQPTLPNQGADGRDSDGVTLPGGSTGTAITTGGPGANNHTYDFGFFPAPPPATNTPTPTITPTPRPSSGGGGGSATATPVPAAPAATPAAGPPAAVPPELPVAFLPETGLRVGSPVGIWAGIIGLTLAAVGLPLIYVWAANRRRK